MSTDKSYVTLYDGHRIAIGISGDYVTGTQVSLKGRSVIEEHFFFSVVPGDFGHGAIGAFDICIRLLDILEAIYIVQYVKIMFSCPIGTHADTEIPATTGNPVGNLICHSSMEEFKVFV